MICAETHQLASSSGLSCDHLTFISREMLECVLMYILYLFSWYSCFSSASLRFLSDAAASQFILPLNAPCLPRDDASRRLPRASSRCGSFPPTLICSCSHIGTSSMQLGGSGGGGLRLPPALHPRAHPSARLLYSSFSSPLSFPPQLPLSFRSRRILHASAGGSNGTRMERARPAHQELRRSQETVVHSTQGEKYAIHVQVRQQASTKHSAQRTLLSRSFCVREFFFFVSVVFVLLART